MQHCPKTFSQSALRNDHERLHTGEKPFKCEQCDASFRIARQLKIHKREHSGEKPYCCEICGERFVDYVILKNHYKSSHNPNEYVKLLSYIENQEDSQDDSQSNDDGYVIEFKELTKGGIVSNF